MAETPNRWYENEWGQKCWRFRDWQVSRDLEQRKVWHLWFDRFKAAEPRSAELLMNELLRSQYKVNGEVWQGTVKKPKVR